MEYFHWSRWMSVLLVRVEQAGNLAACCHVQVPGNPGQRHRGSAPKRGGNPDLLRVTLAPRLELGCTPAQTVQFFPKIDFCPFAQRIFK
jgi:hypothetical protein